MCENQFWYEGCKSYGDNIPVSAWGACAPDDEAGFMCEITGDYCDKDACPNYEHPKEDYLLEDLRIAP